MIKLSASVIYHASGFFWQVYILAGKGVGR